MVAAVEAVACPTRTAVGAADALAAVDGADGTADSSVTPGAAGVAPEGCATDSSKAAAGGTVPDTGATPSGISKGGAVSVPWSGTSPVTRASSGAWGTTGWTGAGTGAVGTGATAGAVYAGTTGTGGASGAGVAEPPRSTSASPPVPPPLASGEQKPAPPPMSFQCCPAGQEAAEADPAPARAPRAIKPAAAMVVMVLRGNGFSLEGGGQPTGAWRPESLSRHVCGAVATPLRDEDRHRCRTHAVHDEETRRPRHDRDRGCSVQFPP